MDSDFWSWFAGFWEGEGSLTIHHQGKYPHAFLRVAQRRREPLDYIYKQLKVGGVHNDGKNPPMFAYNLCNLREVIQVAEHMLPFLRFRQNHVKSVLQHLRTIDAKSNNRRWTRQEIKFLKDNYPKMSIGELAKKLPRHQSYHSVLHKCIGLGLYKKNGNMIRWANKPSELTVENVNDLYWKKGLAIETIAKHIGVSADMVWHFMIDNQIPRRNCGKSREWRKIHG